MLSQFLKKTFKRVVNAKYALESENPPLAPGGAAGEGLTAMGMAGRAGRGLAGCCSPTNEGEYVCIDARVIVDVDTDGFQEFP